MLKQSEIENIKNAFADMSRHWCVNELHNIISNEFSISDRPLDPEIIDAACARLMMLEGIALTRENLQLYEEKLMNGILRNTLGLPSEI